MEVNKGLLEKAKAAKSAEELLEMAKAENIEMTAEDAEKAFADLHKTGELSDEELDNVSGGGVCNDHGPSARGWCDSYDAVEFLYDVGQEVEVYKYRNLAKGENTIRHRILDRRISSAPVFQTGGYGYWPEYFCQNLDDPSAQKWVTQERIENPN